MSMKLGFQCGLLCVYDESSGEDCRLLKMLERVPFTDSSDKLLNMIYDGFSNGVLTADSCRPVIKVWNASSGKNISEIKVSEETERVCRVLILHPYPLVLAADTGGNCYIFGSPSNKHLGGRLTGWMNQTPARAIIEPKLSQSQDFDKDVPHRIVPQTTANRRASMKLAMRVSHMLNGETSFADDLLEYKDCLNNESESEEEAAGESEDTAALAQAISEAASSEVAWGLASINSVCFDAPSFSIYTGDEKGCLRKFDLTDYFLEIDHTALLENRKPQIRGACRLMPRNQKSALVYESYSTFDIFNLFYCSFLFAIGASAIC